MDAIVQVMESTIAARDPYTVAHQQRVTRLADAIAAEMNLPPASRESLRLAGRLHDLGKIAVPGELLAKPGQLTGAEFSLIKSHPQVGYDILQPLKLPGKVTQIILQHHERLDGSGYPCGLKGDEILLEARILAVADVVEAMCSHRPYRPALGATQALEEISRHRGTLYDPGVVDACVRVYEKEGSFESQVEEAPAARRPQEIPRPAAALQAWPDRQSRALRLNSYHPVKPLDKLRNLKSRFYLHAAASSLVGGMLMLAVRGA